MNKVILTVEESESGSGYRIRHNQKPGYNGIIDTTFGWYKYKSEALSRAETLEKEWNK